jgi:dUTP pyrophosphatase
VYATTRAACFDICCYEPNNVVLKPGERKLISTGMILDIPNGFSVRIHPRSGLSIKLGLSLVNCEGVIDEDYKLELKVPLINLSDKEVVIEHKTRVCQAELVPVFRTNIVETLTKPELIAGDTRQGGFGSTGIK